MALQSHALRIHITARIAVKTSTRYAIPSTLSAKPGRLGYQFLGHWFDPTWDWNPQISHSKGGSEVDPIGVMEIRIWRYAGSKPRLCQTDELKIGIHVVSA